MSCINKNSEEYKVLSNLYGDVLAEAIVRKFNGLSNQTLNIPSISEAKEIIKQEKRSKFSGLMNHLKNGGLINEEIILSKLKGIIHKDLNSNSIQVTRGRINTSNMELNEEQKINRLYPNLRVLTAINNIHPFFIITQSKINSSTYNVNIDSSAIDHFNSEFIEEDDISRELETLNSSAPSYTIPIEETVSPLLLETGEYFYNGEIFSSYDQIFKNKELSPSQEEVINNLQRIGLISKDTILYSGREYYTLASQNENSYERLQQYLLENDVDFINIISTPSGYLVELGEYENTLPLSTNLDIVLSSKAGLSTKAKLTSFLKKVGFDVEVLKELYINGEKIKDYAYVDLAKGIIQILEGHDDFTLPEESMHILISLIKQHSPQLYEDMSRDIINYKLYYNTLENLSKLPRYQLDGGLPNIALIKEEAIAKLLSEYLINKLDGTGESAKRLEKVQSWVNQVINWITELFSKYTNPFKTVIDKFIEDDLAFGAEVDKLEGIFFSSNTLNQDNPKGLEIYDRIKNRPSENNIEKVNENYYKDNIEISKEQRVSTLASRESSNYLRNKNIEDEVLAFYDQSREDGSWLHQILELYYKAWVNPETGLKRNTPTSVVLPGNLNNFQLEIVEKLRVHVGGFLNSYPKGTRFLVEQVVYDPTAENRNKSLGRFGTIDILAILPDSMDNKIDIIDWKSTLVQDNETIKDYKKRAVNTQLNEYARILKESYNVEEIRRVRGIPIYKKYIFSKSQNKRILTSISIGNVDPTKISIEQKGLRPIIADSELTEVPILNTMVQKLGEVYDKYVARGAFKEDQSLLTEVSEAIYETRVNNTLHNLTAYFNDFNIRIKMLLDSEEKIKSNKNIAEISEAHSLINFYEELITNFAEPALALMEDQSIDPNSKKALADILPKVVISKPLLQNMRLAMLDYQAQQENIYDIPSPEKAMNFWQRWFRLMWSQDIASSKFATKLVRKAHNKITLEVDILRKQLRDQREEFLKWQKALGLTDREALSKIVNFEKGQLHSKISEDFFEKRREIFESKNEVKIKKFIKENYNLDAYNSWYKKTLKENLKIWKESVNSLNTNENKTIFNNRVDAFRRKYDWETFPITAFGQHNWNIWGRNIKEELWLSDEFKNLQKEENSPILNLYDFLTLRNKELVEIGAIREYEIYTFLPQVRKSPGDIMSEEDKNIVSKLTDLGSLQYTNLKRKLTVEDYELNFFGKRDENGNEIDARYIPYIDKIDSKFDLKQKVAKSLKLDVKNFNDSEELNQKIKEFIDKSPENSKKYSKEFAKVRSMSFELFTIYEMMIKETQKAKYLSEYDETLRALVHMERAKKNLETNRFGKINSNPDGSLKIGSKTGANAGALEEQVKYLTTGASLQEKNDLAVEINLNLRKAWNKSPLGKIKQFDINPASLMPTHISGTKFIMWLNNANTLRVLGLNIGTVLSNLFGGSFSATKIWSKYLTMEDINAGWLKITSGGFYQSEEMKKNAALADYFLPLLDNNDLQKAKQMSIDEAVSFFSKDWLMGPQRKTSEIVQLNIFFGLISNTGLIEGKLVNLREKAMQDSGYLNRFSVGVSNQERKETVNKFENLLKQYQKDFSLIKLSEFKTIKEAGKDKVIIEIPGVNRNSPEVEQIRNIVQTMSRDSLGESSELNQQNYRFKIIGRLGMTFKNWIPNMADVRFAEFHYSQAHDSYEYGRYRMFIRGFSSNILTSIAQLVPIPYLTGKLASLGTKEALIIRGREVYAKKLALTKKLGKYNKDTFISEGEFIERFISGTEATFAEVRTYLLFMLLILSGLLAPDDDDDASTKAWKALMRKQTDKLSDEVGFFFHPKSFIDITGNSPAPVLGVIKDGYNLIADVNKEMFGQVFGFTDNGVEWTDQAKPIKRTFKMFPVLKEFLTYLPAMDEDLAKEWGVRISDRRLN